MRPTRTWHRASLFVALSLVTASAAAFAANPKLNQQALPFSQLLNPGQGTWLGLVVKDVNEASAKELKLPGDYGAIVVSVIPGSPAAKAGFQPNDVILKFDGQRVRSVAQLHRLIEETPAGRTVNIEIIRKGKPQTLQAKIENRGLSASLENSLIPKYRIWQWPAYKLPWQQPQAPFPEGPRINPVPPNIPKFYLGPLPNPEAPEPPHLWIFPKPGPKGEVRPFLRQRPERETALGISGQNLTPQLARFFGVKEGQGILVSQVERGSPASAAGLKAGDVIVSVGSQEVGSMAELRRLLQTQPNRQRRVTLGIVRNRQERQMSVLLKPERPMPRQHGVRPEPIMAQRGQ